MPIRLPGALRKRQLSPRTSSDNAEVASHSHDPPGFQWDVNGSLAVILDKIGSRNGLISSTMRVKPEALISEPAPEHECTPLNETCWVIAVCFREPDRFRAERFEPGLAAPLHWRRRRDSNPRSPD